MNRKGLIIISVLALVSLFAGMVAQPVYADTSPCGTSYTVKLGDYMNLIARNCGVTFNSLWLANPGIVNPSLIFPGQVWNIPPTGGGTGDPVVTPTTTPEPGSTSGVYTVVAGDTLFRISLMYNTTVAAILSVNPSIENANRIFVGQRINLPGGTGGGTSGGGTSGGGTTSGGTTTGARAEVTTTISAGGTINVKVYGFPANAPVDIRVGPSGEAYRVVVDATTDASGYASSSVTIPGDAVDGATWQALILTTESAVGKQVTVTFKIDN